MKRFLNIILSIFTVASITLGILSVPAYAALTSDQKQEKIQLRCQLVTARVNLIVARYDANKDKHIERYKRISDRVSQLITKLENQGYDLTALKADVAKLNQDRETFVTEYNSFIAKLKEGQTFVCGNSEGQFKSSIEQARADLLQARETSLEIRVFINDTLKPDLQALIKEINNK